MANVSMPQLGETVVEGTVTKWFKQVGDAVSKGETLFEVSTDKVDTEIPSPASGVVSAILVPAGETVDVGTTLAVIEVAGEVKIEPSSRAATKNVATTSTSLASTSNKGQLSPAVRRLLDEHHLRAEEIVATGPQGRLTRHDVEAHATSRATEASASTITVSPVVRRLLDEHQLSLESIQGSGPNGRVTRRDVERAIDNGAASTSHNRDEVVPFSTLRRLTADHMVRSKATSAHTLMVREADYESVEAFRRRHGPSFKEREGFSLTYLPFIALVVADAIRAFPHVNASVGDNALVIHHDFNLGVAVDLDDEGLVVPVIRHADSLDLYAMARAIRERAMKARTKRLGVDDFSGGTFTITNPGPFGTLMTGAIINQPQVAILATDAVTRRPIVVVDEGGSERIDIHSIGLLALTFDHRAIDGATAARFLQAVAAGLVERDWFHEA